MTRTTVLLLGVTVAVLAGCGETGRAADELAAVTDRIPSTVIGPEGGEVRWYLPESANELGDGAEVRILVDSESVPHARLGAFVQTTGASGIPVHAHTWQAEILYVISGRGVALVGDGTEEVPLEPGSLVYVPDRSWHGVRNTDSDDRLKILLITNPPDGDALAGFFRNATTRPGEPPLDLSMEDVVALIETYGMELPPE